MAKKVLLTRSKEDNKYLRQILVPKNYACLEISLIEHVSVPFNITILENFTDIIITSKRAANLLPIDDGEKNAWVVGSASAEILRQKNYNIKYVAYSASELRDHLPHNIYNHMIYLSSNIISVEMPSNIKKTIVYKIKYKNYLSDSEIQILKNGIDYILLYSENCAKTLIKLIVGNDLLKYIENSVIIAISSKVEKIVKNHFKQIVTCTHATQILKKLEDYDSVRKY
jgi:uroporphyrinogen-III synthase